MYSILALGNAKGAHKYIVFCCYYYYCRKHSILVCPCYFWNVALPLITARHDRYLFDSERQVWIWGEPHLHHVMRFPDMGCPHTWRLDFHTCSTVLAA